MDRSLDDSIQARQERHRNSRPSRDRRPPRDGIRKSYRRDESQNLDRDWLHDRYDEDSDTQARPMRDSHPAQLTRRDPTYDPQGGAKIRVENLHYDLTEEDLRELFNRIGPVSSVSLVYDRQDRSTGTAYVVYSDARDARTAIQEFDGANANNQPIRLSLVPQGRGRDGPYNSSASRSLFDRIDEGERLRRRGGVGGARGGRGRRGEGGDDTDDFDAMDTEDSLRGGSRRSNVSRPAPEHIDRYVPGQRRNGRGGGGGGGGGAAAGGDDEGSPRRSPRRDRDPRGGGGGGAAPRGGGRRPGQRRQPRDARDGDGRPIVQGRPRKTAEELDAEMTDYWAGGGAGGAAAAGAAARNASAGTNGNNSNANGTEAGDDNTAVAAPAPAKLDGDIDMDA